MNRLAIPIAVFGLIGFVDCSHEPEPPSLEDALALIKTKQFVDLTHAFEPGIPHWPGFPNEERETIYWHEEGGGTMGTGFFSQRYSLVGQWGTHCDPPAHFAKGKWTIDQIDVEEMVLPLAVIDVHRQAANDPGHAPEKQSSLERSFRELA